MYKILRNTPWERMKSVTAYANSVYSMYTG
jgi:hypothetical protein